MAKDVITRFKLETTAFDSAIKQASKELSDYSKTATKAKEGFNQFTKSNVDAARALGTMATSSNNLKGKVQELVGAFNEAAKAYNQLTKEQQQSDFGKAMAQSLTTLQQRIKETKAELQGLGDVTKNISGGGLFGGGKLDGMLQVFGGNMMTKAAGFAAGLASEMGDMIQQGIELARQGEGIRNAFERLGRGDILDGLREATHGTVTDIELMKAAVKFNDFKLPVEELGTMLAFAQQKAKDTGQSVDYMVDSIVTGLGRKSLMILDNLGLSAAEIKEKMAETGDMTKAVGAIIREQMAKAGDYVETAADRAAQANVSLQNKMEELGRKFAPVEEASNQLWTSMKIGILDIIGGPLATLLNKLTEAGRLKNALNDINGDGSNGSETKVEKALRKLREYSGGGKGAEGKRDLYNRQMALYSSNEEKDWRNYNKLKAAEQSYRKSMYKRGQNAGDQAVLDNFAKQIENARNRALAWQQMAAQYEQGAKSILNPTTGGESVLEGEIQSAETLKVKLAELEAQRKKAIAAGDTGKSNDLLKKINQVKKDIKGLDPNALKTTTTTKTEQTEIQKNQKEIDTLTKKYQKLSDAEKTATGDALKGIKAQKVEIQGNIKQLQDRNKELKRMADEAQGINQFPEGSLPALNKQLRELQEAQSKAANGEEYRKLGAEIDTVTRKIAILKGELPKGETATITVSVDADKVDDLRNLLEQIDDKKMKVTVDYTDNSGLEDVSDQERTVTFKADDSDVLSKVAEIKGITIDPKMLEFKADNAEAMKAVEGMKNVTFDKKTLTVIPQTQEAAKELLKLNTFKLVDKQVSVTVNDEKAMKDLQAVAKVTIPDKEVKVKVGNPKAVDVKVNEVAGTQHQAPTLKPIEQTVNYKQGDVDLHDIPDEKTVRVDYEQGDMPDMPDDEQRTVTFKVDDTDVKKKVDDIEKKDITAKKVKLEISTENAETFKNITKQLDAQGVDRNVQFTVTPKIDKKAFSFQNLGDQIAEMKRKLNNEMVIGTQDWIDMQGLMADATAIQNILQTAIQNGMKVTAFNPQELWKRILGGTDIATEELQNMLDQLNEYLKSHGLEPVKMNFETGEMSGNKNSGKEDSESEKAYKKFAGKANQFISGLSSVASGLKGLGIELPSGVDKVIGTMQSLMQIIEGVHAVINVFQTSAMAANTAALVANTSALLTNSTISLIPFFSKGGIVPGLANGGMLPHAEFGRIIPGNHLSGDQVFAGNAMVNSGELVLNRAQQGVLAAELQNGRQNNLHMEAVVRGEDLRFVINSNGRRTGRGEIVTTNFR